MNSMYIDKEPGSQCVSLGDVDAWGRLEIIFFAHQRFNSVTIHRSAFWQMTYKRISNVATNFLSNNNFIEKSMEIF